MIITNDSEIEGNLLKLTFTFDSRFYDKYDVFKFGNTEYICISRSRENENGTWSIDVIPYNISWKADGGYDTKFIKNNVSKFYY